MRKMMTEPSTALWLICGMCALFILTMWLRTPYLPKLWIYPTVRDLTKASVLYRMDNLSVQESKHFIIKYQPQDASSVQMILDAAEAAYEPVTTSLGFTPAGKATIVVIASKEDMQQDFGWSGGQSAVGVYWSGLIEVLSPKAWLYGEDAAAQKRQFVKNGPVTHEFTHLVVDAAARGNYPRWFTEGIAQYQEYRLNGYEWLTSTNRLDQSLYTMQELERNFDGLDNQSLAYRESFAAVRYMYDIYGEENVRAVLHELNRGKSMRTALKSVLKMDYGQFEQAWQQWARIQMQ